MQTQSPKQLQNHGSSLSFYEGSSLSLHETSSSLRDKDIAAEIESAFLPSSKYRSSIAKLQSLKLTKLRFDSVGLYGRDTETSLLMERLSNVTPTMNSSSTTTEPQAGDVGSRKRKIEMILLSGFSGTGKSKLASTLKKATLKEKGIHVSGKYEFNAFSQDKPYLGIATACSQICEHMMRKTATGNNESSAGEAVNEIVKVMNEMEIYLLAGIIPKLNDCIAFQKESTSSNNTSSSLLGNVMNEKRSSANLGDTKAILMYAFRKFIRIVCNYFSPVVIVLDDMQWADLASVDLLQELLTDEEVTNLMIIVCYRSNEVDDAHSLSKLIRDLKNGEQFCSKQQQNVNYDQVRSKGLTITNLHLGNIDVTAANQVIMALLNMEDSPNKTLELARVCHKRTEGNIFFFLTFVELLQQCRLLEFDIGKYAWTWNLEEIETKTAATPNLVDSLSIKMKRSSSGSNMIQLLTLAACLGSTFEKEILKIAFAKVNFFASRVEVAKTNGVEQCDGTFFNQLLDDAIEESYLEKCSSTTDSDSSPAKEVYRFVHDRVQEAAMSLLPQDDLNELRYQVGVALLKELNEKKLEDLIFVVVNLLNSPNNNKDGRAVVDFIEVAELNLRASKKAKMLSAFVSSAKYVSMGITYLPQDDSCLKKHFRLYLDLYSTGAEIENYLGNTDQMMAYCDMVKNLEGRVSLTMLDKLRVYKVLIDHMGNNGKPKDALMLCIVVLRELGFSPKFPCSSVAQSIAAVRFIVQLKSNTKKNILSIEDISSMPIMSDEVMIECAKLLDLMISYCFLAKQGQTLLVVISRLLTITSRFGICYPSSATAFACVGMILTQLGDYKNAALYAELALGTVNKLQGALSDSPSRTILLVHAFILCWQNPLIGYENKFMEAYKKGLQYGDTENACFSISAYLFSQLAGGKTLAAIDEDMRTYIPQMKALKRESLGMAVHHQAALNLMGCSKDCTRLYGEAINEVEFKEYVKSTQSDQILDLFDFDSQFVLAYLGEHKAGAELAIKRGDIYQKNYPGEATNLIDPFIRGICLYAMARTTGGKTRRKYLRHAKRAKSTIRSWAKKGNPNVVHHLKLLDAEHEALSGKFEKTSKLFFEATVLAARGGFTHDAAISNERYAIFLLESKREHDHQDAKRRMKDAYKYYSEWGAQAKLDRLRRDYSKFLL